MSGVGRASKRPGQGAQVVLDPFDLVVAGTGSILNLVAPSKPIRSRNGVRGVIISLMLAIARRWIMVELVSSLVGLV